MRINVVISAMCGMCLGLGYSHKEVKPIAPVVEQHQKTTPLTMEVEKKTIPVKPSVGEIIK